MKCKYEGPGIYEGRCFGTKEIDPCPGYDKCEKFKPNVKTNSDWLRELKDNELAMTLANKLVDVYLMTDELYSGVIQEYSEIRRQATVMTVYKIIMQWLREPYEE